MSENDFNLMRRAIELALSAAKNGCVPFGAVLTKGGEVVAEGENTTKTDIDSTAHAEIVAIRNACKVLKSRDLSGCTLYCSTEPCPMCAGAISLARISKVFYGSSVEDQLALQWRMIDVSQAVKDGKCHISERSYLGEQICREESVKTLKQGKELLN